MTLAEVAAKIRAEDARVTGYHPLVRAGRSLAIEAFEADTDFTLHDRVERLRDEMSSLHESTLLQPTEISLRLIRILNGQEGTT